MNNLLRLLHNPVAPILGGFKFLMQLLVGCKNDTDY